GKVHEDNSTDELDWEYSKNKLTIKLPQEPMDHIVPVIRVEMLDNLLIIPEKTVVENTDGNWLIKEKDLYTGCSYADQGHYFSLTQTTVRQSAFISNHEKGTVSLMINGIANPDKKYH